MNDEKLFRSRRFAIGVLRSKKKYTLMVRYRDTRVTNPREQPAESISLNVTLNSS